MDANSLLAAVASTYRELKSMALEVLETNESLSPRGRNLNERTIKAFYSAPDKVRIEQEGRKGIVIVTNGSDQHTYLGGPNRYSKGPPAPPDRLPGVFQPEHPISGTTFLFSRIADNVERAEILSEEADGSGRTYVLSVVYQPPHRPRTILISPIRYRVDAETHLVKRAEAEIEYRMWAHDETHTNRVTIVVQRVTLNQPVPPETFEFEPPADAIEMRGPGPGRGFVPARGGGGGAVPLK